MPTPEEPGQPHDRQVLEPIRVLRPRNTDALAELFREMTEDPADGYEAVPLPGRAPGGEAETRELPTGRAVGARAGRGGRPAQRTAPGRAGRPGSGRAPGRAGRPGPGRADGPPRVAVAAVAVLAAALVGFACALLLPGRDGGAAAGAQPPAPAATATAAASAPADPDGAGTLREGDSGPGVTELQQRLRRIPNVYDGGPTDGRYGSVLTEAVARFQLWYGIRGDETGVYGDDTRRDLESRTASAAGG
ncbi:peptidoglycan-binding domain-containing protein [Streptomyces sp. AK04-3B]|uniref:peptidoglycan-binding domain-containing protein n=2 Tax=unclassified Streptomyces TaxID=2593676 RepID=UPI0029A042F9|nr:peptidoglycan-binding domain-containing protein [Streptomyces sp. AK04-3B]MDX3804005.1 peptidoglycan-binding domain-containing protein [Streptomyces sp. AK04-3B]